MSKRLSRRQILQLSLLGGVAAACTPNTTTVAPSPTAAPTNPPATSATILAPDSTSAPPPASAPASSPTATAAPATDSLAPEMAGAANSFLQTLTAEQRAKATYAFDSAERFRWHWTTPGNFPRNGLPLTEMGAEARTAAFNLLQASVSLAGYQKALDIMSLQRDLGNDPELYFVTVFGEPGGAAPWGWRWEGHHLSHQFTVSGESVAMTPFFLGAWPTVSSTGLRAMPREEDAALELATSVGQPAIFQANTLTRHVTQNDARVSALDPVGVAYSDLTATQQGLALEIIQAYLSVLPESLSTALFERLTAAGLENIRFGWAGPLELRRPTYYRLQGPTFLLEHDKSRNGGTHIHSVWRDYEQDFGYHLL